MKESDESVGSRHTLVPLVGKGDARSEAIDARGILLDLPRFERDLREQLDNFRAMPALFAACTLSKIPNPAAVAAILAGDINIYTLTIRAF